MDSLACGYINIHGESPGKGKAQQKQDWRCKICQHVLEAATVKGMGWKILKLGLESEWSHYLKSSLVYLCFILSDLDFV